MNSLRQLPLCSFDFSLNFYAGWISFHVCGLCLYIEAGKEDVFIIKRGFISFISIQLVLNPIAHVVTEKNCSCELLGRVLNELGVLLIGDILFSDWN